MSNNMNPTQSRHDQSSWSKLISLGTTKQVLYFAITTMVLTAGFLTIADEETPLDEKSIQDQEAQMLVHTSSSGHDESCVSKCPWLVSTPKRVPKC